MGVKVQEFGGLFVFGVKLGKKDIYRVRDNLDYFLTHLSQKSGFI